MRLSPEIIAILTTRMRNWQDRFIYLPVFQRTEKGQSQKSITFLVNEKCILGTDSPETIQKLFHHLRL
jgi:ABC-type hemin transport system substrate-binding protein